MMSEPILPSSTSTSALSAGRSPSIRRKIVYSVLMTLWFFVVTEATLWIIGFEYRPGTMVVEKDGHPVAEKIQRSLEIGWELEPNRGGVNEVGFIGASFPIERQPGVLRIAGLGDSCTQFGDPPYIELVRDALASRRHRPVESLNAGVSGFSSHQGLIRLRRDVARYKPDVVVVYFGWNDHWVLSRTTDAGQQVELNGPLTKLLWKLDGSKLVQAGLFVADGLRRPFVPAFRVPLNDYANNLHEIIREIRALPAVPILVTAPTDATPQTSWGEFVHLPRSLAEEYSSPAEIHATYVAMTKLVADQEKASCVDAAADFGTAKGLIMEDHIHPTQKGYERIAALVTDALMREKIVEA